jgi:hypothetical protein
LILQVKAATVISRAITSFIHMDTAGVFQRLAQRIQSEVIYLLAGDDGNGLRRFAQREREFGGGSCYTGGVGTGEFGGGVALALPGNGDGGKGNFLGGRRRGWRGVILGMG